MSRGKHKYHYGTKNIYADECPDGYLPGWVYKEGAFSGAVENRKKTCLEKYGSETYNNSQKNKQTCLDKYGSTSWLHSDIGSLKTKETLLERYGVENPMKSEEVRLNTVKTTALNLGYSEDEASNFTNVSQIKEIKQKVKNTCNNKYGFDSYLGSPDCLEKSRAWCQEKFGVDYYNQTEECKSKIESTNNERYGVPYYCMTSDCRSKSSNNSLPNQQFAELLKSNDIQYEQEFRLNNYSYDFKVNDILIEINPTATHNSTWGIFNKDGIDSNYHMNKSINAESNNYRCIHIFDWDDQNKIISMLSNRESIYARSCDIKEVSREESKQFLTSNHIQGYVNDSIRIGLYYNGELVSLMTFGKPRYNKNFEYELLRYCSIKNITGGAEKIFSHFLSSYSPASIISYCDTSKFSGATYEKLGFKLINKRTPSKHWYNIRTKKHITNNLLLQRGFDQLFGTNYGKGTSNEELMRNNGFVEVYDCGQSTYALIR